jgi:esterase/lipase superfamily enzyme
MIHLRAPHPARLNLLRVAILLAAVSQLAACASRPTDAVLQPVNAAGGERQIALLTATDRTKDADGQGFASGRAQSMLFESYSISIPPTHQPSKIEWAKGKPNAKRDFVVTKRTTIDRPAFLTLAGAPAADGSVGLFVHGYNYSYQEGLFRLAQIAADAKTGSTPVLFSWPSEATVTGYVADRDAALFARDDLVAVITGMSRQPKVKKFILFGHSMGGFLIMEALRQLKLEGRGDVLDKLVVILAAPDIDADVFRKQLTVIGPLKTPLTLFVSKDDKALRISSFLGGERQRAGRLDVADPVVEDAAARYGIKVIDITSVKADDRLGHDRYANLAAIGPQLVSIEERDGVSSRQTGAFVFDAAASVISSPFRLAGRVIAGQ